MDTLMPVITAVSLVAAIVATAIAVRVTRDERRRRAARVAALAAAAGLHEQRVVEPAATPESAGGLDDFLPADHAARVATPAIFSAPVADSGSGGSQHRLLAAAAGFGIVVLTGAAAMFVGARTHAPAATARPPLELVTLGHDRSDTGLAVTGVVRNPETAAGVTDVQADVRVFDAAGLLITSRQALIAMPTLAPGQESPFTLALGDASTAARYRVSFSSAGVLLPHVDRRTNLPAAVTADAR